MIDAVKEAVEEIKRAFGDHPVSVEEEEQGVAADRLAACIMLAGLVLAVLVLGFAGDATAKPVTVAELLADSPAEDWRVPDPEDTLYLDLARGRVVIELASRVIADTFGKLAKVQGAA